MTRRRSRQFLAVLAVTTALCADQVAVAAPSARTQASVAELAGRIVGRLTVSFRRTVAEDLPARLRQRTVFGVTTEPCHSVGPVDVAPMAAHVPLSPFQFRLPPPSL